MSRLLTTTVLALAAAAAMAPAAHAAPPVGAAVGDIACDPRDPNFNDGAGTADRCRQSATADVVARGPAGDNSSAFAAVLTLGDEQYDCGSPANFSASYDQAWGRFGALVWPVPGNHEYKGWSQFGGSGCQADGSGYYDYFGARASGVNGKGYYSFDIGAWHVIALNSNCRKVGGCDS